MGEAYDVSPSKKLRLSRRSKYYRPEHLMFDKLRSMCNEYGCDLESCERIVKPGT